MAAHRDNTRKTARRAGALLAAAALGGSAFAAAPALADQIAAPAEKAPTIATPVADLVAQGMAAKDPNADGYDKFIVTYKEGAQAATTSQGRANAWGKAAKAAGVSVKELRATASGSHVVQADKKLDQAASKAFMLQLAADPSVESVEPDAIMTVAASTPSDALYSEQWGFHGENGMNVEGAWDAGTGEGSTVAVLDTGIVDHPDLNANVSGGYDFISDADSARDGDGRDADPSDEGDWIEYGECNAMMESGSSWHGTHVAGTIGAVADTEGVVGVAPDTTIQPVRVLGKCGGSLSDIADAIVWASGGSVPGVPDNPEPADVINMSLGGSGMCGTAYQSAIDQAVANGTTVVVAAGNESQPAANSRPANCDNVVTVAASDEQGSKASFSNYGDAVDVTAPGAEIISTVDSGATTPAGADYAAYQGTSMAAPHVAGVAALLVANGTADPAAVEQQLKDTARTMPGTCAEGCGAGLVDAAAALGGSDVGGRPE